MEAVLAWESIIYLAGSAAEIQDVSLGIMPAILFVCTANICRSPMAEALLRRLIAQRADADAWRVESAGTWGMDGYSAANRAQLVMLESALDISGHRARTVDRRLLSEFDLILTMEGGHKEALCVEFPEFADRIYMLTEMIGYKMDIQDPITGTLDNFRDTAQELEQMIGQGLETILSMAQDSSSHLDAK